MKFLHTSDWHLGVTENERSLLDDQKFFIDNICRIIEENKIDAVLLAGDVYDRSVASADAIKLYDYAMTRICGELSVPVLSIAGNHDSAERLSSCRDLLKNAGLHIVGSLEKEPQKVSFPDADVYSLPWITEEKVKSVYPEEKENINSLTDAYKVVTDRIRSDFADGKRHIILSHAFVSDSEVSESDRAAQIGYATQISASVFEGFDYVALGHLHRPQNITEKVRYSGTPMPYSFGKEESHIKSVTVIDTDSMEQTIIPLELLHKRTTLTGTLEELLRSDYDEETINGYVRINITDSYLGLEALSELKKVYPCLLEASGKNFESEESSVTLSIDQLENLEKDPVEVFKFFCNEQMESEPDEHLVELFRNAVKAVEEEVI